jgi:hypothetical protein
MYGVVYCSNKKRRSDELLGHPFAEPSSTELYGKYGWRIKPIPRKQYPNTECAFSGGGNAAGVETVIRLSGKRVADAEDIERRFMNPGSVKNLFVPASPFHYIIRSLV